jgi:hypothetical protein
MVTAIKIANPAHVHLVGTQVPIGVDPLVYVLPGAISVYVWM